MELNINPKFENLLPSLTQEESAHLRESLKTEGCRDPIITWNGTIIDGHNRYAICRAEGIEFDAVEKDFKDETAAKVWIIDNQGGRRNLTDGWKFELAQTRRELLAEKGKEQQGKRTDLLSKNDKKLPSHNTQKGIAAELGWSTGKVAQADYVWKHAAPEVKERVKANETSIHEAYKQTHKITREANPPPATRMPSDKYRVLYADPPWKYSGDQHAKESQATTLGTHYPSMATDEICALPVSDIADNNAVLFLWSTSPFLPEALEVIDAWGFKYKASMVWDKVKHNVGHYVSVRHEFLLIATRGSCIPDNRKLCDSVHTEERTEHSKKPEHFRAVIDDIYRDGKRIELFRRGPAMGKWEAWGNEC